MFTCTRVATGQEIGPGKNSSRSWKGHGVLFRVRKKKIDLSEEKSGKIEII